MYAFWTARYFGIVLAVLGMVGIAVAAFVPAMLVMDKKTSSQDQMLHRYNGYFVNCIDEPTSIESAGIQSKCKFAVAPSTPTLIEDMPACVVGEPKDGFTFKKQNDLFGYANFLLIHSAVGAVLAVLFSFLHGTGCLRYAHAAIIMSVMCALTGCAAIVVYYVAINPCKKDICTAMNDEAGPQGSVHCWAASPVVQIIAMITVLVGAWCSQRWAAEPDQDALMDADDASGTPAYTRIAAAHAIQANAAFQLAAW